jgi:hypothetical protein
MPSCNTQTGTQYVQWVIFRDKPKLKLKLRLKFTKLSKSWTAKSLLKTPHAVVLMKLAQLIANRPHHEVHIYESI